MPNVDNPKPAKRLVACRLTKKDQAALREKTYLLGFRSQSALMERLLTTFLSKGSVRRSDVKP